MPLIIPTVVPIPITNFLHLTKSISINISAITIIVKFTNVPIDGLLGEIVLIVEIGSSLNNIAKLRFAPIITETVFTLRNIIMINPKIGNPMYPNTILPFLILVTKRSDIPTHTNESATPNFIVTSPNQNDFGPSMLNTQEIVTSNPTNKITLARIFTILYVSIFFIYSFIKLITSEVSV